MLKMDSIQDMPSVSDMPDPQNIWMKGDNDRKIMLDGVCKKLFDSFVDIRYNDTANTSNITEMVLLLTPDGCSV